MHNFAKNNWRRIHLWLGLAAGFIFFLECFSGTCLVFEEEMKEYLYRERFYVDKSTSLLPLDDLVATVKTAFPKETIGTVKRYADPYRTVEVSFGKRTAPRLAFVNPYTGTLITAVDAKQPDFFTWMLRLHQTLLMGKLGKTILGISTFIVLSILISGIVLWWPKTRKILKQKLKIKYNGSWKRLNHDLHIVLGFYCAWFLCISLFTSLPWSFTWANDALYTLTGSKPVKREKKEKSTLIQNAPSIPLQEALVTGQEHFKEAPYWMISIPSKKEEVINLSSASTYPLHRNGFDQLSIDQYSGKVLGISLHQDSPAGWQLRRYMKPIHTGSIGGLWGKSLAFVICLISASFPITGILLWLNRRKKNSRKRMKSRQPRFDKNEVFLN